jgi:hypothetical protein
MQGLLSQVVLIYICFLDFNVRVIFYLVDKNATHFRFANLMANNFTFDAALYT